jgi:large subunit ribosomal protein L24
MKSVFSSSWKSSKQPRKQRKYVHNLPIHLRKKIVSVMLSRELRLKYKKRNTPLKVGDKIKIMRGNFKKRTGDVTKVDRKHAKALISGIDQIKKDGNKVPYPISTSNLMIIELKGDDKYRIKNLERK